MMMFPAFDAMLTDRRVRPRAKGVYFYLVKGLALYEYRPVKLASLSRDLGVKRSHLCRDLRDLVETGYLIKGGRAYERGPFTYQLSPSLPTDTVSGTTDRAAA